MTTPMQYTRLGNSGLWVSRLILGCMSYGSNKWQPWVLNEEEGIKHIKQAWSMGINTFDTADTYSNGESERVLGKALKEIGMDRDEVVILTKVFFPVSKRMEDVPMGSHPPENGFLNRSGLSRKHIFDAVKGSLERLGTDHIDVLQCHRFDYTTPIEETMQALNDVVKLGWVRYIGMSSCFAHQFQLMQQYAITHNLTPFTSMQNLFNATYREEEFEMLPTLKHFGVGCIPWSPLARGFLTRPHNQQNTSRSGSDRMIGAFSSDADKKVNEAVEKIAKEHGKTMAQVACAYVLSRSDISAPIIGSTHIDSIGELVNSLSIKLTEDQIKAIEEHYTRRPQIGFK